MTIIVAGVNLYKQMKIKGSTMRWNKPICWLPGGDLTLGWTSGRIIWPPDISRWLILKWKVYSGCSSLKNKKYVEQ